MATFANGVDTSKIAGLVRQTFKTPFIEMMRNEVTVLKRMSTTRGVGPHPMWKIQYGRNDSVGAYNENDAFGNAGAQTVVDAQVDWALNRVIVQVSGLAQAATRGAGAFFEALSFELKWALPNLKDEINQQLMSKTIMTYSSGGGTANGIDSLGHIVQASGTYAGLDRTLSYWQPYVDSNGGSARPLTIIMLQKATAEMDRPERRANINAIWTSRTNFNQYGNLLQDQRSYTNTTTLDGGFVSLPFEGRDVMIIPGLPAGDIYLFDESVWEYQVLLDFQTDTKDVMQDADRMVIKTYSQLVCKALAKQARLTDLPTS